MNEADKIDWEISSFFNAFCRARLDSKVPGRIRKKEIRSHLLQDGPGRLTFTCYRVARARRVNPSCVLMADSEVELGGELQFALRAGGGGYLPKCRTVQGANRNSPYGCIGDIERLCAQLQTCALNRKPPKD